MTALQDSHGHTVSQTGQLHMAMQLSGTSTVVLSYQAVHAKRFFGYVPDW